MGKTERGEEIQPVFEEKRRRRMAACPNLHPLLFSSSPSPLSSLYTAQGVGGAGSTTNGYCSNGLKNNFVCQLLRFPM